MSSDPPNSDDEKRRLHERRRRQRLLYSLNDLQQARSACEFLYECDEDEKYSKIDLRRFRCYETTLVVAYTRPFSQSIGEIPALTMKMIDLRLSPERQAVHDQLIQMRNKIMAHSDAEMMRMTTEAYEVGLDAERPFYMMQTVFDEGVTLLGQLLMDANTVLNEVHQAIVKSLYRDAQANPEQFNLRIDSAEARRARRMIE